MGLIRLWDKWVCADGHRRVGPVTLYAFTTAMHGAINVRTRWGALCVAMPWLGGPRPDLPGYAYLSPNRTPWAATWLLGRRFSLAERRAARARRALWGHGYDCERLDPQILDAALFAVESRDLKEVDQLRRMLAERNTWISA